jgi:hypothetical protein
LLAFQAFDRHLDASSSSIIRAAQYCTVANRKLSSELAEVRAWRAAGHTSIANRSLPAPAWSHELFLSVFPLRWNGKSRGVSD